MGGGRDWGRRGRLERLQGETREKKSEGAVDVLAIVIHTIVTPSCALTDWFEIGLVGNAKSEGQCVVARYIALNLP